MKIAYFDLETRWLFSDIHELLGINKREEQLKKLKLSVAGVAIDDGEVEFFTPHELEGLIDRLSKANLIVGHNLMRFDWEVLSPYVSSDKLESFKKKTFDTLYELSKKRKGDMTGLGLDALGKINFNVSKTTNTKLIPCMWRTGMFNEVEAYLKTDVELVRKLYQLGIKTGKIKMTETIVIQVDWN